jgi:hypothetical protein
MPHLFRASKHKSDFTWVLLLERYMIVNLYEANLYQYGVEATFAYTRSVYWRMSLCILLPQLTILVGARRQHTFPEKGKSKATAQQFVFRTHPSQQEAAGFGRMSNWLPKCFIFSGQASLTLILSGFYCWGSR